MGWKGKDEGVEGEGLRDLRGAVKVSKGRDEDVEWCSPLPEL